MKSTAYLRSESAQEIRAVIRYVTPDGREFADRGDAAEWQYFTVVGERFLASLPDGPSSHGECIDHGPRFVRRLRFTVATYLLGRSTKVGDAWERAADDVRAGRESFALGRELEGAQLPKPWMKIIYRARCTDDNGREYQQLYFRNHPDEAVLCG